MCTTLERQGQAGNVCNEKGASDSNKHVNTWLLLCTNTFVFFALWTGVSGSLLYTSKGPGESKLSSFCCFAVAFVP